VNDLLTQVRARLWLRHVLLAGTAIVATILAFISYTAGALSGLERQSVDARFGIRGPLPPDGEIVIVAVDTRTLLARRASFARLPRADFARLLDRLHAAKPRLLAVDAQFTGQTDSYDDKSLVAAVARDGPVLLATHEVGSTPIPVPAGVPHAPGAILASAAVDVDSDGVLRRMMYAPIALKTFAVRAAELLLGRSVSHARFPDNHAWVDFRGPPGTFPSYSAIEVLENRVAASAFAGKTVLIGVTDPSAKDVFITAASSVPMAGVEFQANALSTILDGFPLQPLGDGASVVLLFVLAALPALLAIRLASLWVVVAATALLVLFLVAAQLAFDAGVIVPIADPLLALALATIGVVAAESFVQRKQLRNLQELFDLLPSPVSDFFISYRRGQSELAANTLREGMARKFGEESVFMDREAVEPGEQWPQRLQQAIASCRAMLVVVGPQWLEARAHDGSLRLSDPQDWVRREVEAGLLRREIAVVPVLHDGAKMPSEDQLPGPIKALACRQAVELTGHHLEQWIEELSESIQRGRLRDSQPTLGATAAADAL
jgi:CHASE2 domain-containing sensor protein